MNKCLLLSDEWLRMSSNNATIIWEDNQPLIDILKAGHITGNVKYMSVPIAVCHFEIKLENGVSKKIPGILNLSDLGNKPFAALALHRL